MKKVYKGIAEGNVIRLETPIELPQGTHILVSFTTVYKEKQEEIKQRQLQFLEKGFHFHAYDTSEGTKHETAKHLLKQIWEEGGGVVCVQNLMEFFVVITKKVESPIPVAEVKTIVDDMSKSDNWRVIDRDIHTFLDAIDLVSQYHVHLWDATIAACMREHGITAIVTENTADFEKIPEIQVIFPF